MRADPNIDGKILKIALSIGSSTDLERNLSAVLSVINRTLGCCASLVALFGNDRKTGPVCRTAALVPRGFASRPVCRRYLQGICASPGFVDGPRVRSGLPATRSYPMRGHTLYAQSIPLEKTGLLTLFTREKPLGPRILAALLPVAARIAAACGDTPKSRKITSVSESRLHKTLQTVRRTQEELRSSKNHLALILQSLGEGVVVVGRDLRVSVMNVKAMEYLDFAQGEKEMITIDDLFSRCEGDRAAIRSFILDDTDDDPILEVTVHGPHTARRILGISKNHIRYVFSEASEIILSLRDITRDREIDRLKNEFISNLSHELRTPMNAILGVSKILSRKNAENLNARQKEGLAIIYSSGQRLLSLINDLLDLSKIEAGKMEIIDEPFPLTELIADLDSFTRALVGEKPISMEITAGPGVPAVLLYDRRRLQQVLTNLLSNAVKFTEEGHIGLSIFVQDGSLFFRCADSGIGISRENLPLIFDRFRQLDGSASRKYPGSGLGLSLSRELVTLMGGEIFAESLEEGGTAVIFHLPLRWQDTIPDTASSVGAGRIDDDAPEPSPVRETRALVLVADDESSTREMIAMILDSRYELHFAADGREAVDLFERMHPGMVLLDIMMPGIDGHQALKMIRSKPGGAQVPVIAITARAMKGEREKILESGFDAYLSKPIDDEELIRQMAEQFERLGTKKS
jgi:signal transduction histidine kinase/ActR/RegA family two-component response regulator